MNRVFVLGGLRSHIGIRNGIFKHTLPEILGAEVLKALVDRYKLKQIDQIICGNVVGTGGNIGRLSALQAGIPEDVPTFTIDSQCASGLTSIDIAFSAIRSGQCEILIAGGIESTSLKPHRFYHENDQRFSPDQPEYQCAQFAPHEYRDDAMILGAERVAEREKIGRPDVDRWALASHQKALAAQTENLLSDITISISGSHRDEAIRKGMSPRLLDRAPAVSSFPNGVVTAANACTTNDGAAFVVLCSEKWLRKSGLAPQAEVISSALVGCDPLYPPLATGIVTDQLLEKAQLTYEDIDAFEYNEAFGVIDVLFERAHPLLVDRYNRLGGALAYGHPYGASGGIIFLHLLKSLEMSQGKYGVASIAAAGGIGQSILLQRVSL